MQYFTKFLPVEGEIKEGDIVQGVSGYFYQVKDIFHDAGKATSIKGESLLLSQLQKVKLFLCSRDIQVGDIMTVLSNGCLWGKPGETCILMENFRAKCAVKAHSGMVYYAHCDIAFSVQQGTVTKVIGEISPAAVWIKEGDEVDEAQTLPVILYADNKPVLPYTWGKELQNDYPNEYRDAYQIKCPTCGTFH